MARCFLLGQGFAAATGIRLLPDPYDLALPEWSFVLSHGRRAVPGRRCLSAFRARVRTPAWQEKMLGRPRFLRRLVARWMRWRSRSRQQAKAPVPYAELQGAATDDFLRDHGYVTFIHGHTHRPAKHDHIVDGIHVERWVLADWHEDRGECLVWDGETLQR